MDNLIEKYAMQCTSWPYWRDMPNDANVPAAMITEWPEHITDDQKAFWRTFVTNMIEDLRKDTLVVQTAKIDEILSILRAQ
jgi:hypothetical protein